MFSITSARVRRGFEEYSITSKYLQDVVLALCSGHRGVTDEIGLRYLSFDFATYGLRRAGKAASSLFDGLLNPVIFLTNCSEAVRTSPSVTGGSELKGI